MFMICFRVLRSDTHIEGYRDKRKFVSTPKRLVKEFTSHRYSDRIYT